MGIFKTRQNKKFDYTPRYFKGEGNPYEMKHKFDDFRKATGSVKGLKTKFNNAIEDYKHNQDKNGANKRVLIIIGVLILVFFFIIEFDFSIFFQKL
ncbi:riboflavin synthase subunit beta [Flavobacteriaceae bacterium LMO-SS05]